MRFSLLLFLRAILAMDLTVGDSDSVCDAATDIINGIMDYYEGTRYGGTIGLFQSPYYWWEAGEVFGGMLETWFLCQNDTYEDIIYDALIAQRGSGDDYVPSNQSLTEGNDDQSFWGFAVMDATERNFTNPPSDEPGWLALSQGVFNSMWARWDNDTCSGGVRWQIFTWNSGYDYKNTISNGGLFHMAARLARYTSNDTYADVAETVWDWLTDIGFVDLNGDSYSIYDGAKVTDSCGDIDDNEWTYNFGVLLAGTAYLYNYTEDSKWETAATQIVSGMSIFLDSNVLYERQCQSSGTCTTDERSFRSITARCLGLTAKLVPSLQSTIMEILDASASGAAASCSGGTDGVTCGQDWSKGSWDDLYGLGEQISALEAIQSTLILTRDAPYTADAGGSSTGDVNAGMTSTDDTTNPHQITVTKSDKARAGVVTAFVLAIVVALAVWMVI